MKSVHKYINNSFIFFSVGIVLISILSLFVYGRGVYFSSEKLLEEIVHRVDSQATVGIRNTRNNLLVAETIMKDYVAKKKPLDINYVGTILASTIYYNIVQKDIYFSISEKYIKNLAGNPTGQVVFATRKKLEFVQKKNKDFDEDTYFIRNYDIQVYNHDVYLKNKSEVWYYDPINNSKHLTYVPPYYDFTYIKDWLVTLSRAVYDNSNQLIGVVGIDFVISDLKKVYKTITGEWGMVLFQQKDGKILFDNYSAEGGITKNSPGYKETIYPYIGSAKEINRQVNIIQHRMINGKWFVYKISPIEKFPWMVMVYRPLTAFYAPVAPFAFILIIVIFCMMIGLIYYLKHIQNQFLPVIDNFVKAIRRDVKLVKENKTISGRYEEPSILEISEIVKCINSLFEVVNENFKNYQTELEKNIKIKEDLEVLVMKKTEQLVQKEKMAALGVMTAGIAHEIKNPLNLICSTAEIIAMQLDKLEMSGLIQDKDIWEKFDRIRSSNKILTTNGKRVDNIIRTLLTQTRSGSSVDQQKVLLDEIIQTSLDFILVINRPKINNQITLNYTKSKEPIYIWANPVNLGRVFINIFDNSIYAITNKLEISQYEAVLDIQIKVIFNMVEIKIRDNGIGMSKEQLNNATTPFFTTKPAGEGSGLGLSFVYENVKDLGGSLDIESEENRFTEITITLPIKDDV